MTDALAPHNSGHIPVLLNEVLHAQNPQRGGYYVDCTFGGGGYTRALIENGADHVLALDRDPSVVRHLEALPEHIRKKITFVESNFAQLPDILRDLNAPAPAGIVLDLGVSSFQLDQDERGFSFRNQGPLDMRMSGKGLSAKDVVNVYSQEEIADILYNYGEEKKSRHIARAIVKRREETPFETTLDLADLIAATIHKGKQLKHPATRSFQALRIFVNKELEELESALKFFPPCLKSTGIMSVVSFHSLEDRMVKRAFLKLCGRDKTVSRYVPEIKTEPAAFKELHPKQVRASEEEIARNPRSRSAVLRSIEAV